MSQNRYSGATRGTTDSPGIHFEITPSDDNNLTHGTVRAIYVGTGGNLSVEDMRGNVVIYQNIPDGYRLDIRAVKVRATGTTASDLVGLV